MSDVIRLLPDSVANQIAAGEVIQRPASVIKELVENAVDAGATDISIVIKDAGKTMIQIIDNGCGMSETDARLAFERHATSKIRNADDLFSLRTMGFRGEALPSICAISEVEIRTRTADAPMGTRIVIEASKVMVQEPCVCDKGTVFTVRKLFFNVPARRKFLKSDNVELSNIMREFERLALVNNNIRLHINTGSRRLDLRAGSFHQRIEGLWKNNLNMQLLPVEVDTELVKISGFISRPEFARRRNPLQFLFVNGRNMKHPYFHKAIVSCFETLIAADTQPCYFIKFEVDPQSIDVNIHPTKSEIKFEYEHEIWPILTSAIKASLGKFSAVPSIDFTMDAVPLQPLQHGEIPECPEIEMRKGYNPFDVEYTTEQSVRNWESIYKDIRSMPSASPENSSRDISGTKEKYTGNTGTVPSVDMPDMPDDGIYASHPVPETLFEKSKEETLPAPLCMQYAGKYIVTPSRDGLLIIDQHRAHVKILYEEYMHKSANMSMASQGVMFPETISLDETQMAALAEIEEDLKKMGFRLEYESGSNWSIMGIPATLKNVDAVDLITRIIDSVTEDSVNYGKDSVQSFSVRSRIALLMARAQAIRGGMKLTVSEMEYILSGLFAIPDPAFTPNGNPVFCILDESRVDSMFR